MAFPAPICTRMAAFCQKFVRHLDEELRQERFVDLVRGTQPGPLNLAASPSRGVLRRKGELVDAFVDNFAVLLRDCESVAAPGVVRAKARVLFYRRFLRTIGATGGLGVAAEDGLGVFAEEKRKDSPARHRRSQSPPQHRHDQQPQRDPGLSRLACAHSMAPFSPMHADGDAGLVRSPSMEAFKVCQAHVNFSIPVKRRTYRNDKS